ncbi:MAG: hypothetical protein EBU55_09185, partial [Betaproteobacteria bacterium]|nr:hypothetical protein [Betaproteobacteria bacterium]
AARVGPAADAATAGLASEATVSAGLRLRHPLGGRRQWEGELARGRGDSGQDWVLLLSEATPSGKSAERMRLKATAKKAKQKEQAEPAVTLANPVNVLNFNLDEIERAHLVPHLVF